MKDIAKRVFDIEIESLQHVAGLIDDEFTKTVDAILSCTGKVVVIGIGKSGLIGKKIAATLASTGTPSFFCIQARLFMASLGMVSANDTVMLISYSGETDEVLRIIPFLKWNKNLVIGVTGNSNSTVAKNSHHHLNIKISREACPLELAPTSSTTAALVMGDALAVALMESRGFKQHDFARFHPGGSLGRKLLVKVKEIMRTDKLPFIHERASFTELLLSMSAGRLGMVMVGEADDIKGIITDGDLRRALLKHPDPLTLTIAEIMTVNPLIIDGEEFAGYAEQLMIDKKITTLLVGSASNRSVTGVYQIYSQ